MTNGAFRLQVQSETSMFTFSCAELDCEEPSDDEDEGSEESAASDSDLETDYQETQQDA